MKLHEREMMVNGVEIEATSKFFEMTKELTRCERVRILASMLASEAKYGIREERHGNTNTPGGLADEG